MEEPPRSGVVISGGFQLLGCGLFSIIAGVCGAVIGLWLDVLAKDDGFLAGLGEMCLGFLVGAILGAIYGGLTLPWAFNSPSKSEQARRLRISWVLASALALISLTFYAHADWDAIENGPSNAELIAKFHRRKPMLETFVSLSARPNATRGKAGTHPTEAPDDIPIFLSEADLRNALSKFREYSTPLPSTQNGLFVKEWSRSGAEKGIAFLPTPPKGSGDPDSDPEVEYRHIEGNWYVYERFDED